jgi:hypothetical protein
MFPRVHIYIQIYIYIHIYIYVLGDNLGKIKTRITLLYDNDISDEDKCINIEKNKNKSMGNMNEYVRGEVPSPVWGKPNVAPMVMPISYTEKISPTPYVPSSSHKNTEMAVKLSSYQITNNQNDSDSSPFPDYVLPNTATVSSIVLDSSNNNESNDHLHMAMNFVPTEAPKWGQNRDNGDVYMGLVVKEILGIDVSILQPSHIRYIFTCIYLYVDIDICIYIHIYIYK